VISRVQVVIGPQVAKQLVLLARTKLKIKERKGEVEQRRSEWNRGRRGEVTQAATR